MSSFETKFTSVQRFLQQEKQDGWLLYDFRRNNDLACQFLEISNETFLSRRFCCWIPKEGEMIKIVHRIESHTLDHLPGKTILYSSYEEWENALKAVLNGSSRIIMEYSPRSAIPTVSKVDGGTLDLVRSCGVTVGSSADILQHYTSVCTPEQFHSHRTAAVILQETIEKAWAWIADCLKQGKTITEVDVQAFILKEFTERDVETEVPPICAVNAHSANPHYSPTAKSTSPLKQGDFVLIDAWCKQKVPQSIYADITRVGVLGTPTERHQEIFAVVKQGRDAALNLIRERLEANQAVRGWEVDQVCRMAIANAGYGAFFTHRTGHNIGEKDHGDGANIDNFETKEERLLLPGTCFSIEPGVYLPGEFGVRLEDNVFIDFDGRTMHLTPGLQTFLPGSGSGL